MVNHVIIGLFEGLVNLNVSLYNKHMYVLVSKLESLPVMSLQTGETIATIDRPVIDVGSLKVAAYLCDRLPRGHQLMLMVQDIRQIAGDCIIIDSEDELTDANDVVRLQEILRQNFSPLDKTVVTELGQKLGSVEDFTVNLEDSRIQKLYIRQPLFRSWVNSSLIIDRTQIVDVTPKQITVRDAGTKVPVLAPEPTPESHT